jgi:hypothetical protein
MKKIKHSKIKNTGILFELLVRQITSDIINGDSIDSAKKIVSEFFKTGTELNKELRLYQLLQNERYSSENRAESFLSSVLEARKKINSAKLSKEKYELIREVNSKFDMDSFMSSPISNYKLLASIYKLFENNTFNFDVKDIFDSKITILENITTNQSSVKNLSETVDLSAYKSQDKDIRLLTYQILVESFNKKYDGLNEKQQKLLKEYINNMTNTTDFSKYLLNEVSKIVTELNTLNSKISDKITKIKLTETINSLNSIKINRTPNDSQVSALMLSYELIKELNSKI